MKPIRIVSVRKNTDPRVSALESDYAKRLAPFARIEFDDIRQTYSANGGAAKAMEKEAALLEDRLAGSAFIALDKGGRQRSSEDFAKWLAKERDSGKDVVFVIGGPYGIPERVLEKAKSVMSLSSMTLPHELARLMLLEQIYRASDILKGGSYHK